MGFEIQTDSCSLGLDWGLMPAAFCLPGWGKPDLEQKTRSSARKKNKMLRFSVLENFPKSYSILVWGLRFIHPTQVLT